MNSFMQQFEWLFRTMQKMRQEMMDIFSDEDLHFSPGGDALTLGAICKAMGETEYAYIQSFKTGIQEFSYRSPEPELDSSVQKLKAWFNALDEELISTLQALTEDDLNTLIDRVGEAKVPAQTNAHIYHEAVLIFFGKISIYMQILKKTPPPEFQRWIG